MDASARAAFIQAMTACAVVKALGMMADNQHRLSLGQTIAYDGDAFRELIDEHGIGHNAVIDYLRG